MAIFGSYHKLKGLSFQSIHNAEWLWDILYNSKPTCTEEKCFLRFGFSFTFKWSGSEKKNIFRTILYSTRKVPFHPPESGINLRHRLSTENPIFSISISTLMPVVKTWNYLNSDLPMQSWIFHETRWVLVVGIACSTYGKWERVGFSSDSAVFECWYVRLYGISSFTSEKLTIQICEKNKIINVCVGLQIFRFFFRWN